MAKTVYVGMSGGVDSSVTAALLKEQGFNVIGVYMKNWTSDFPGSPCTWKEDFSDAKRVAVQLGIEFKVFDFQKEYKQKVVDYMVEAYKAGLTPNPDIMCNQEIKFDLFYKTALEDGAELIATGHYARTTNGQLLTAVNDDKDQTYFLYRVNSEVLRKTLFPIGEFKTKIEVRDVAKKFGLATSDKKDSQGICFVGQVGIKEFLSQYIKTKPGDIIDQKGKILGQHDGAIYYTVGQRHGLNVGGGLPYYVVGKDMGKNQVFVTNDLQDESLWRKDFQITNLHWINESPKSGEEYFVRTRHRAALVPCKINISKDTAAVKLYEQIRALTAGQSAVIYKDDRVIGGGVIV